MTIVWDGSGWHPELKATLRYDNETLTVQQYMQGEGGEGFWESLSNWGYAVGIGASPTPWASPAPDPVPEPLVGEGPLAPGQERDFEYWSGVDPAGPYASMPGQEAENPGIDLIFADPFAGNDPWTTNPVSPPVEVLPPDDPTEPKPSFFGLFDLPGGDPGDSVFGWLTDPLAPGDQDQPSDFLPDVNLGDGMGKLIMGLAIPMMMMQAMSGRD